MSEEKPKYISIAIQDPLHFIDGPFGGHNALTTSPKVKPVNLDLVKRVEKEYSGLYGTPSGKFAFFNKSIKNYLRRDDPIIRGLDIKLESDGDEYLVGGYIESEFFLTPKDRDKVAEGFPLANIDLGNLRLTTTYARPDSWKKSDYTYERKKYEEGWLQIRVGINTDDKGNLQTKEKKGLFGRKKVVEDSRLINLPDNKKEAFSAVLENVVKVCQVVESGVNSLYAYARQNFEPIGEVQLAYIYPENRPQILFASIGGDETLAKSYSVIDGNGTKIYKHYLELDEGDFKVRQSKDEPAREEDKGTRTIDKIKPKSVTKPAPKFIPVESKANIQNGQEEGISFDDVVGATEAKKELMRVCNYFRNPEEFRPWGISQKAGVLLYGPPGTGKTLLARGIANEADAQFMLCESEEMMGQYVGESEGNLKRTLDEAKKYEKCILLMDEFDSIARRRKLSDKSQHGTEGRLVSILLKFLDGFERQDNVYLIGATNRKDIIDDAILQRLYPIEVPLPDFASRAELVKRRVEKHGAIAQKNPFGEIDYDAIARESEGLSGRELVGENTFQTLLCKAKELTDQNNGKLYLVSTQDWLDEIQKIQKIKPKSPRIAGFRKE